MNQNPPALAVGSVNAYDIDPVAVRVAGENAAVNGCRIAFGVSGCSAR